MYGHFSSFIEGYPVKRSAGQDFMLAEQLEQVIGGQLGRRQWEFILLTRAWKDVVGERAAAHTLPAWIKKDILWGYVDGSSWMQELTFMKPQLLKQVNGHLRSVVITDIRWLQKPQKIISTAEQEFLLSERVVDSKREEEFEDMTKIIDDPGCQQALFHLWQTFQKKMR